MTRKSGMLADYLGRLSGKARMARRENLL